jgi:hypothetical protein
MVNYSGSENIGNVKHLRHNDGQQTNLDQKSLFESLAEMRNGIKNSLMLPMLCLTLFMFK